MKTFQYSTRDYVPSVDLNTLGKTFDTLEQGHKEAVKAASDLEVTMANLPLNEAENEWRQQKINEIKQTIDDNTIFGNSYAALDDLILKTGNLMADQGMIGRLQAQQDFKNFETRILNDQSLTKSYKEYFLEKNPYHYKDEYDDKGNLIGGTKWKPTVSPTTVINPMDLLNQALKIASEDAGSYTRYRWLDENGNITNDYRKSAVGEYFDATTSQWQRLSEDKIRAALNSVIKTTHGAKESLLQDYNISLWYGKKNDIDTDAYKNNSPVDFDKYIENKFAAAIKSSAYSKNFTDIKMGGALSAYRQLQIADATNLNNTGSTNRRSNNNNWVAANFNLLTKSSPVEYNINVGNSYLNEFTTSQNAIYRLLKEKANYNIKPFNNNSLVNIENLLSNLKKNNRLDDNTARQITNLVKRRNNALTNYKLYIRNLKDNDLYSINDYNSLINGRNFKPSTTYGKNINKNIGAIGNGTLYITVTDRMKPIIERYFQNENIKKTFNQYYNSKTGTFEITINQNTRRLLPGLSRLLYDIENESNKGMWNTITTTRFKAEINGKDVTNNLGNINDNYVSLINKVGNINKNMNVNNKYLISTPTITDATNFTSKILRQELNIGNMSASEYSANVKAFDDGIESSVRNALSSQQGEFLYSEGGNPYTKLSPNDKSDIISSANEILNKDGKHYTINPQVILNRIDPINGTPSMAYKLTWSEGGVSKSLLIAGAIDENSANDFLNSNYMLAYRDITTTTSTSSYRRLNDENSHLGAISVKGNNGYLDLFINGRKKKNISIEGGIELSTAFNILDNIRDNYSTYGENYLNNEGVKTELGNCVNTIVTYTGISEDEVLNKLNKDFNSNQ